MQRSEVCESAEADLKKAKDFIANLKKRCEDYKTCIPFLGCAHPCREFINDLADISTFLHVSIPDTSELQQAIKDVKKAVAIAGGYTKAIHKLQNEKKDKNTKKQSITDKMDLIGPFNDFIKKLKNTINIDQIIKIKEVIFAGDYKDFIHKKEPFILMLKYQKPNDKGDTIDYFTFKPNDIDYIKESFALLPVTILDKILSESKIGSQNPLLADAQQWFEKKIKDKISVIKNNQLKVLGESKANMEKYKKILQTYDKNLKNFEKSFTEFNKRYGEKNLQSSMTEMMPHSKVFKNRYLAVGHSSLCLGVAPNGVDVYQENCKDIQSERWTAKSLGNGYVQLKSKGLCLKAKTKNNKNGQPLVLAQCDENNIHEQWKIISRDLFFDRIVNRYSQKCLHFDSENANPKTAYATWTSCIGADSQTFRDIADAERPTWHKVEDMVEAKNGSCLSTKNSFDKYFNKNQKGHLTTTRKVYDEMIRKGDDVLISTKCKKDIEDKFNYIEQVNGDIKLVHAQSGLMSIVAVYISCKD